MGHHLEARVGKEERTQKILSTNSNQGHVNPWSRHSHEGRALQLEQKNKNSTHLRSESISGMLLHDSILGILSDTPFPLFPLSFLSPPSSSNSFCCRCRTPVKPTSESRFPCSMLARHLVLHQLPLVCGGDQCRKFVLIRRFPVLNRTLASQEKILGWTNRLSRSPFIANSACDILLQLHSPHRHSVIQLPFGFKNLGHGLPSSHSWTAQLSNLIHDKLDVPKTLGLELRACSSRSHLTFRRSQFRVDLSTERLKNGWS